MLPPCVLNVSPLHTESEIFRVTVFLFNGSDLCPHEVVSALRYLRARNGNRAQEDGSQFLAKTMDKHVRPPCPEPLDFLSLRLHSRTIIVAPSVVT